MHRRSFLASIIALAAAPAIVRAGSLMPVKVMPRPEELHWLVKSLRETKERIAANILNDAMSDGDGRREWEDTLLAGLTVTGIDASGQSVTEILRGSIGEVRFHRVDSITISGA